MGYAMINKFRRAITFGKPIQSWYRVPMTWDDNNWHIIVRPPSHYSVAIQEIDFHSNEQGALHLHLAYQKGGVFYDFDHVQSYYESGFRSFQQTYILPANAEFVIRRDAGDGIVHAFSARGYFIRPAGPGAQRIDDDYGTYVYGIV
jgi:hypothetical protein